MDRIAFVTGGTGFVGSHLVDELLRRPYAEVRCLVRKEPKWLSGKNVVVVQGDLSNEDALREGLFGATHVFHVAGVTRAPQNEVFMRENVEATVRLLRFARSSGAANLERVLITSSLAAVGVSAEKVANEETPLNPISMYGRSKALMESRVWGDDSDGKRFQDVLPITVVRPSSVYGPRERDILTFFKTASRGLSPVVGGNDSDPISLVFVMDLVKGIADAADSQAAVGETYFLGSQSTHSWHEISDATVRALGRRVVTINIPPSLVRVVGTLSEWLAGMFDIYPPLNREKAREIIEACKACSSLKAYRDFGYSPAVTLEEGIRTTIEWYRQEGWLRQT